MSVDAAVERALESQGESDTPIYRAAAEMLRARGARGVLVDVGCGTGRFLEAAADLVTDYVGVDVVRHSGLSPDAAFLRADLDRDAIPVSSASADIVAAVETIEHLENPRAFVRELARLLKPGGWLVITTPNQVSLLSLLCLIVKARFAAFQDASYPVHRTALLPIDLVRMAEECGLERAELGFSCSGRIPLTSTHYPATVSCMFPQALSDNVLLVAQRARPVRRPQQARQNGHDG
jgi:2-polyprenyl-3-methyl-5-hydroxy-6-metoxy-1,4-benzoquinol methylase